MNNDSTVTDDAYDDESAQSDVEKNIKSGETWLRGLFMLISCVLASVAFFAGSVLVVLGFFWVLFTGETNPQVREAGLSVARYIFEITRYLTFNSDEKPFPLGGSWPSGSD